MKLIVSQFRKFALVTVVTMLSWSHPSYAAWQEVVNFDDPLTQLDNTRCQFRIRYEFETGGIPHHLYFTPASIHDTFVENELHSQTLSCEISEDFVVTLLLGGELTEVQYDEIRNHLDNQQGKQLRLTVFLNHLNGVPPQIRLSYTYLTASGTWYGAAVSLPLADFSIEKLCSPRISSTPINE